MKKALCIALLTLVTSHGMAWAQNATTELLPAAPHTFPGSAPYQMDANLAPDNPAATQWGEPVRVGAGTFDITNTPVGGGNPVNWSGYFIGGRFYPNKVGVGLELISMSGEAGGYSESNKNASFSMEVTDGLALGLGLGFSNVDDVAGGAVIDVNRTTLGVSFNMDESIFFGFAMGKDTYVEVDNAGVTLTDANRSFTLYGLAWREQKDWTWYLAYDAMKTDGFANPGGGTFGDFDNSKITLQVIINEILLGLVSNASKYIGGGKDTGLTLDVGWTPDKEFTITGRLESMSFFNGAGIKQDDMEVTSINVAYLF